MSHKNEVETMGYINTDYSSGDFDFKHKQFYQEENNNEINELSKEFSEMGCIVDAVKKPPNICIETCVYEEGESINDNDTHNESINDNEEINDEIRYSDEFEEEESDIEFEDSKRKVPLSNGSSKMDIRPQIKLSKSHSSVSNHKPSSVSGRSVDYGSISVPPTRRVNMSFTNERLREIERHNHILLNKILSARNKKKSSIPPKEETATRRPVPPAAVHRKMQQRKIDHDNMILLKKIQRAKSSACSIRR